MGEEVGGGGGSSWKQMSKGGAGLALALSLTGSGQCPAAEGRGPAYAHKLISSASAGLPAQSGCLHCGPQAFSCWWGGRGEAEREARRGSRCETASSEACQVAELHGKHELPPG